MQIIKTEIKLEELREQLCSFGDFAKAVVDVERGIMAVGGELHADEERILLEDGSKQENLWGINIYPGAENKYDVEFDSMINLRTWQNNKTRGVNDQEIQKKIIKIVDKLVC